jgi:hypothetical protein
VPHPDWGHHGGLSCAFVNTTKKKKHGIPKGDGGVNAQWYTRTALTQDHAGYGISVGLPEPVVVDLDLLLTRHPPSTDMVVQFNSDHESSHFTRVAPETTQCALPYATRRVTYAKTVSQTMAAKSLSEWRVLRPHYDQLVSAADAHNSK